MWFLVTVVIERTNLRSEGVKKQSEDGTKKQLKSRQSQFGRIVETHTPSYVSVRRYPCNMDSESLCFDVWGKMEE